MARKTLTIFDIVDLANLRLRCNACEREYPQSIEEPVPPMCPNAQCNQRWGSPVPPKVEKSVMLIEDIRDLIHESGHAFTVRFEVETLKD